MNNKISLTFFAMGLIALMLVSGALAQSWSSSNGQLSFTNKEGIAYSVPLSNWEQNLNFQEANSENNPNINKGELFVLTAQNQFTHVLRYDSIDATNRQLTFTDLGTGTREVTFDATTSIADLVVAGTTHKIKVDSNGNLAIDQNGDGAFTGDTIPITTINGDIIRQEDLNKPNSQGERKSIKSDEIINLNQGVSTTYVLGNREYELTLIATNAGNAEAQLNINGQELKLRVGQVFTLPDGTRIFIEDVAGHAPQINFRMFLPGTGQGLTFQQTTRLSENSKQTYILVGTEYEVEVLVLSETANQGKGSTKLRVNGQITNELSASDSQQLLDKQTYITVKAIYPQVNLVEFYFERPGQINPVPPSTVPSEISPQLIEKNIDHYKYVRTVEEQPVLKAEGAVTSLAAHYYDLKDNPVAAIVSVYSHANLVPAMKQLVEELSVTGTVDFARGIYLVQQKTDVWAVWLSKNRAIVVGNDGSTEIPDEVIDAYLELYPSTLEGADSSQKTQTCNIPVSNPLFPAVSLNPSGICMGGELGTLIVPPAFVGPSGRPIANLKPEARFDRLTGILSCSIPCQVQVKKTCLKDLGVSTQGANYEENPVDRTRCGEITPIIQPPPLTPPDLPGKDCTGCEVNNRCLQFGVRLLDAQGVPVYCDFDEALKEQKQNNEYCQNNHECLSNSCGNGKCRDIEQRIQSIEQELQTQKGILQKILDFFNRLFGG